MDYYRIDRYYIDKSFVNVVRSIVSFIENQRTIYGDDFKFKELKNRNHDIYSEQLNWLEYRTDPDYPERSGGFKKDDFLDALELMIACIETPKIRKAVTDHYNAIMTSYCYSLRKSYTERLEEEKKAKQEAEKLMLPKPYVISSHFNGSNTVYMPRRDVWTNEAGDRMCVCVHMCDKFQSYPVLTWGIKLIYPSTKCKYCSGSCHGSHIFKNGEFIDACTHVESCIVNGLKPQKTK